MAQPTWLEMQSVPRSGSGMYTVSMPCTSSMRSIHLRVPSAETLLRHDLRHCDRCDLARAGREIPAPDRSWRKNPRHPADRSISSAAGRETASRRDARRRTPRVPPRQAEKIYAIAGHLDASSLNEVLAHTLARTRADLNFAEEVSNLPRGRIGGIRAMHHVLIDAGREVRADGALGGLFRVRRPHHLAILRDGTLALEHLHHAPGPRS